MPDWPIDRFWTYRDTHGNAQELETLALRSYSVLCMLGAAGLGNPPRPREEERSSDKLCEAIQNYFSKYAVGAEREVQIRRRRVAKALAGTPGSDVDVLVRVPATFTGNGDRISIPIEVKRSSNDEAKSGLRSQLVERYMCQSGASCGAFVVMWFDAPGLDRSQSSQWTNIDEAKADLEAQAAAVKADFGVRVVSIVIDCSIE